ncbi:MAG: hypothetical protein B7Y80_10980 [Hyphomicrobium sp. 32-62-53]|nr:MAG: hypothetical protein B7Z29_10495 [Hyphomicrobium sp. 12-62-95]OYX99507.1 MAG: hypothetical protein B7Y80_10980 [Hyphomicrobium sp. 32-62-53]
MINKTWRAVILAAAGLSAGPLQAAGAAERPLNFVQAVPRPFDSRPANGPPTPAPRSFGGDTTVLPRVPYDNRIDRSRRYVPDRQLRRSPDSSRVVPKAPGAGGDPARFFDKPAENTISCEQLRRLAVRTGRLYWSNRYQRCIGAD